MPSTCATCKNTLGDRTISCDSCLVTMHPTEDCTGLGSSEIRAAVVQRRTLFYFCTDCRLAFKSAPVLIRKLESLAAEVETLKIEVQKLKDEKSPEPFNIEDVIGELSERQKRANNLLVFNLPTPGPNSNDTESINALMQEVLGNGSDVNIAKVFRFGKQNKNGNRPVKVVLGDAHEVFTIIKNKHRISRDREIFIHLDQTPKQRKTLDSLRSELSRRQANGEQDLTIKYLNNVPKIVAKNR